MILHRFGSVVSSGLRGEVYGGCERDRAHGPIKFAIILAVALPAMLASYHLLVRFTIVGVVLNGRRAPGEPAPAAAA